MFVLKTYVYDNCKHGEYIKDVIMTEMVMVVIVEKINLRAMDQVDGIMVIMVTVITMDIMVEEMMDTETEMVNGAKKEMVEIKVVIMEGMDQDQDQDLLQEVIQVQDQDQDLNQEDHLIKSIIFVVLKLTSLHLIFS